VLFPIRDDQPTYRKPRVTVALIVINSLVFLYTQVLGWSEARELILLFGYVPDFVLGAGTKYIAPSWIYATPFTSMFLHGGWMHLIGNMLFLWIFGNNIEDHFGPIKFIIFYLISGLAAIALYTLFNPGSQVPLVGASGAIAGVMGAYLVLYPRAQVTCLLFFFFITFVRLPAKVILGYWLFFQVLYSFTSLAGSSEGGGIAFLAHVGGFLFGWLLLKLLRRGRGGGSPSGRQRVYRMQW
jgi:membrane associated rhomboid family serine protease